MMILPTGNRWEELQNSQEMRMRLNGRMKWRILRWKPIEWSPSRTGLINPVAIFTPVELEGTTVSRASVHNISIMRKLELGIGDKTRVYKANMIIPQIEENLTKKRREGYSRLLSGMRRRYKN